MKHIMNLFSKILGVSPDSPATRKVSMPQDAAASQERHNKQQGLKGEQTKARSESITAPVD